MSGADFMDPRPVDGSDVNGRERTAPVHATTKTIQLEAQEYAQKGGPAGEEEDAAHERQERKEARWKDANVLLTKFRSAETQATTYLDSYVRQRWARTTKAYNNEHFDGSKYKSPQFRARSKIFRPKTRSAVRKQMTAAAEALFSGKDVVAVSAQDENDPNQRASAAIKQELMNYRLDRKTRRNGIPWFRVAMGARQDATLSGVCVSKQSWRFREKDAIDQNGMPYQIVREDRPDIELIPPENVLISPSCNWLDPVSTSEYLIIRYNMSITDILDMVEAAENRNSPLRFIDLDEAKLRSIQPPKQGPTDTQSPRIARHSGGDPTQMQPSEFPTLWLHECFIKIDGEDVVFWTVGQNMVISSAAPVEDVYPAFSGDRPVVMGVGEIQPHRVYPQASADSWQQMQQEMNDQVNLRLDHMKQVVSPLAKVKRGVGVDLKQVQARGANNGVVMVQSPDDLDYVQIPDLPQSAYMENNLLNAEFDDLAGTFNAGSVQSNRQLNETVGGMKLLAGSANSLGTFDLTVWGETWVEPVLWQVLKLIEYYESDPVILAIAGQRAQLIEKFGRDEITDELLQAETHLTIKIGMGIVNEQAEKMQKLAGAFKIVGEVMMPLVQAGAMAPPQINPKEIIDEIFGAAGYKNASERFFFDVKSEPEQGPQQGPDPQAQAAAQQAQMQAQAEQGKLQVQQQKNALDHEYRMRQLEQDRYDTDARTATADADRIADMGMHENDKMMDILALISSTVSTERNAERQAAQHQQQMQQQNRPSA